jgi:hypothetical protein
MIHHTIDSQATLAHPTVGATIVADRADPTNPNRHIWNNNGTWWLHYTVHLPDYTKRRVRESLGTRDVEEARRRRDARLASLGRGGLGLGR